MKLVGDGGYRELSPKRYELWQFVEVDGKRKQRTKRVKCGKRDVGEALRAFQTALSEECAETTDPGDFASYVGSWLAWKRECGRYSPVSVANYQSTLGKFDFGDARLSDITPQDCRDALVAATCGLSGTSSRYAHTVLKMVFESARKDGLIASNPMENVEKPRIDTKERKALSPDELDALWHGLCGLPLDGRVMVLLFCVDAGLRIGEAMTLETDDVGEESFRVSHSKTKRRLLPMTDRLRGKCREWESVREAQGIADAPTYCCRPSGLAMQKYDMYAFYKSEVIPMGAPEHVHDLRHSNLSRMARYMSAHDLQRWAGWSSIEMAQRYVHDDFAQLEAAVRNVG